MRSVRVSRAYNEDELVQEQGIELVLKLVLELDLELLLEQVTCVCQVTVRSVGVRRAYNGLLLELDLELLLELLLVQPCFLVLCYCSNVHMWSCGVVVLCYLVLHVPARSRLGQ